MIIMPILSNKTVKFFCVILIKQSRYNVDHIYSKQFLVIKFRCTSWPHSYLSPNSENLGYNVTCPAFQHLHLCQKVPTGNVKEISCVLATANVPEISGSGNVLEILS